MMRTVGVAEIPAEDLSGRSGIVICPTDVPVTPALRQSRLVLCQSWSPSAKESLWGSQDTCLCFLRAGALHRCCRKLLRGDTVSC